MPSVGRIADGLERRFDKLPLRGMRAYADGNQEDEINAHWLCRRLRGTPLWLLRTSHCCCEDRARAGAHAQE